MTYSVSSQILDWIENRECISYQSIESSPPSVTVLSGGPQNVMTSKQTRSANSPRLWDQVAHDTDQLDTSNLILLQAES